MRLRQRSFNSRWFLGVGDFLAVDEQVFVKAEVVFGVDDGVDVAVYLVKTHGEGIDDVVECLTASLADLVIECRVVLLGSLSTSFCNR